MTRTCSGARRTVVHVWSGIFDPRMAGVVRREFVRDPYCDIHGDPVAKAELAALEAEDRELAAKMSRR
jgi:hypothetical protein